MNITVKCLVHQRINPHAAADAKPVFEAHSHDMTQFDGYVLVGPATFEFDVPEAFNPVAAQVSALEKNLSKLADDYHRSAAMIRDRISKLTCIENSPAGAA